MANDQNGAVNTIGQAQSEPDTEVNLDDFRWNLAAVQAIVKVTQIAVESAGQDVPQEAVWRTLAVAADLSEQCHAEFDSDLFEAAWRGKAVRS